MKSKLFLVLACSVLCAVASAQPPAADSKVVAQVGADVAQLSQPDEDLRWRAKLRLLQPESRPLVQSHQAEVISALSKDWQTRESALILGQLDLPAGLRQQLRDSGNVPDSVRARLGDAGAEQRVISAFQGSLTNYGRLHKTAEDLLYADTAAAWKTFGQALGSQQILEDVHGNQVSVVAILLFQYSHAHPEEPLFAPAIYGQHADVSAAEFKNPVHQAYLRQLEERLRVRHNLSVTLNPPLLLNTTKIEKY